MNNVEIVFEFENVRERRAFYTRAASNKAMHNAVVLSVGGVNVRMWMDGIHETTRRKKPVVLALLTEVSASSRSAAARLKL